MTHSQEIVRYASMPDSTKVWYKKRGAKKWTLGNFPSWEPDVKFIINDDFAEIRKAFVDNHIIEIQAKDIHDKRWLEYKGDNYMIPKYEEESIYNYRIKPKVIKTYQYICRREGTNDYQITNRRYESIKEAQAARNPNSGWNVLHRYELSEQSITLSNYA